MFGSLKIAMVLVLLAGAGGAYVYVTNLQKNLAISEANNAKLETAVGEQKAALEQMQKDFAAINLAKDKLEDQTRVLNAELNNLNDKFNKVNASGEKRDIANLAVQKPALIERAINTGTRNAQRCVEIAMGSPLTEKEQAATKKSEINPECPSIANPKYVPY
jgi:septal ring factor EnvC (AmiA/AmiB activator)